MSKREGFDKHALSIAASLHRVADEIERGVACQNTTVSFTAQEIISTITRGVANLRLGLLVRWTVRVIEEQDNA